MTPGECVTIINTMTPEQKDAMYYLIGYSFDLGSNDIDAFIEEMRQIVK